MTASLTRPRKIALINLKVGCQLLTASGQRKMHLPLSQLSLF